MQKQDDKRVGWGKPKTEINETEGRMPNVEKTEGKAESIPMKQDEKRSLRVLKRSFEKTLGRHVVDGSIHDHLKGRKLIEVGQDHRGNPRFEIDGLDSVLMTPAEFVGMVEAWKSRPAY
jgi:hypothetical protein